MSVDRFGTPLYGVGEAAGYLGVPPSTLAGWAFGYEWRRADGRIEAAAAVITAVRGAGATLPFIGLAEGFALAAFRRAGVPLQRIRPAIEGLRRELGVEYALASQRLYADGAEILYDYAQSGAEGELVVVRSSQQVFAEGVARYLRGVEFGDDGYARVIRLPQYRVVEVTVDADHGFGRPRFVRGGASVDDVIDLVRAGESAETAAAEFGLSHAEVEDALRVSVRTAA